MTKSLKIRDNLSQNILRPSLKFVSPIIQVHSDSFKIDSPLPKSMLKPRCAPDSTLMLGRGFFFVGLNSFVRDCRIKIEAYKFVEEEEQEQEQMLGQLCEDVDKNQYVSNYVMSHQIPCHENKSTKDSKKNDCRDCSEEIRMENRPFNQRKGLKYP